MRKALNEKLFGRGLIDARTPPGESAMDKKFTLPPFSVLDARQGKWKTRKRAWINLGIKGEVGRQPDGDSKVHGISYRRAMDGFGGGVKAFYERKEALKKIGRELPPETIDGYVSSTQENTGTSVFDPVLTELCYQWFCPIGGQILDPFAGGSTRGFVAGVLGYDYTGIEVRKEQVESNLEQVAASSAVGTPPRWIVGDSTVLDSLVSGSYDLIFTCPPYYNLETYSGGSGDGSMHGTYEEFLDWYYDVFNQAVGHLKDGRFLVVVVGEVRDKKTGAYYGFVPDNFNIFKEIGLHYYNELVLVTSTGSLIMRAGTVFDKSRKIGKQHQNVLVFYKGNPREVDVKETFNLKEWRET